MRAKTPYDFASDGTVSRWERPLPARILQLVGLVLVIGLIVLWAATGKQSALMMFFAAGLALLGRFDQVFGSLLSVFGRRE